MRNDKRNYIPKGIDEKDSIRKDKIYSNGITYYNYIFLCKTCNKEMAIRSGHFKKSTGLCNSCFSTACHAKEIPKRIENGCNECKRILPLESFSVQGGQVKPICKDCVNLKPMYKINYNDYLIILQSQDNKCAICKRPETSLSRKTKKLKKLAVDHCHKTGKIRGLLCTRCNSALGMVNDNIYILEEAIKYLKLCN